MVMDTSNPALSSVETVVPVFYRYAFTYGNKGYGATFVILLLIILFLTVLLQKAEKKFVFYN
jgi:multiple sugar transport system permease protein